VEWAILAVAAVGTAGTLVGVGLEQWRRRRRLDLEFQGAWKNDEKAVVFTLRVSNGPAPISRVDIQPFTAAPGWVFSAEHALEPFRLDPYEHRDIAVPFWKPSVDIPSGTVRPTFIQPLGVIAFYGRKKKVMLHPDSPPADDELIRNLRRGALRPIARHP
jgi:hypothetical protein